MARCDMHYDPSSEDEVPWYERVLSRAPIAIEETVSDGALAIELLERLGALLESYHCDATPEGWRNLALRLAIKHEPGLRIELPIDRDRAINDRERSANVWANAVALRRQIEDGADTQERAAARLQTWLKTHRPASPQGNSLKSMAAEMKHGRSSVPRWVHHWLWDSMVMNAAIAASKRLSDST